MVESSEAQPMRYMTIHDWPDWQDAKPIQHNVYFHDFAMLASHDVPCSVCWERPAKFTRDMTPGCYRESWQPCNECQAKGWRLVQQPRLNWWRRLFANI